MGGGAHVERYGAIAPGESGGGGGDGLLRLALALHSGFKMRLVAVDRRLATRTSVERPAECAGEPACRLEVHQVAPHRHVGDAQFLGNDAHLNRALCSKC